MSAAPNTPGFRLKMLRVNKGLSVEQFAKEIGVSKGGMQHIEAGRSVGVAVLFRAAKAFNVDVLWLVEGKEPSRSQSPERSQSNDGSTVENLVLKLSALLGQPEQRVRDSIAHLVCTAAEKTTVVS